MGVVNGGVEYVTQLTREDLKEVARMCNLECGPGIVVERSDDSVRISIDQAQLKRWMWNFYRNGGVAVGPDDVDAVNIDVS